MYRVPNLFRTHRVRWRMDVVNFQDHADELRGQRYLLLLAGESFDDILLLHVEGPGAITIDSKVRVLFLGLTTLDGCDGFDGRESTVLSQS